MEHRPVGAEVPDLGRKFRQAFARATEAAAARNREEMEREWQARSNLRVYAARAAELRAGGKRHKRRKG